MCTRRLRVSTGFTKYDSVLWRVEREGLFHIQRRGHDNDTGGDRDRYITIITIYTELLAPVSLTYLLFAEEDAAPLAPLFAVILQERGAVKRERGREEGESRVNGQVT